MAKKTLPKANEIKQGTFTAQAKKRGVSVYELERKVLANPGRYSDKLVKQASLSKGFRKARKGK